MLLNLTDNASFPNNLYYPSFSLRNKKVKTMKPYS